MATFRIHVAATRVLTFLLGVASAASALAQPAPAPAAPAAPAEPGWAEIRILPAAELKEWEKKKHNVGQFLKNNKVMAGPGVEMFDNYFQLFLLPQLAQPEHLAKAPAIRDELTQAFFLAKQYNNVAAIERLNDMVLDYMLVVARGPVRGFDAAGRNGDVLWNGDDRNPVYWKLRGGGEPNNRDRGQLPAGAIVRRGPAATAFHPACRYNAMLVIGQLNEDIKIFRSALAGETPLGKALKPMVDIAGDPKLPEPVRLAAMIGIRRHVDLRRQIDKGVKDETRDVVCSVMTRVCKEPTEKKGHLADGHVWLRRQAIGLIGACGGEGLNQTYSRALSDRLGDINEPLSVRQAAAVALALVQPAKLKPGDAAELANRLANLAVDVARFELDPAPQKLPQFSRRRAGDGFDCTVLALGGQSVRQPVPLEGEAAKPVGVLAGAADSEKPYVQGLIDRISALRTDCAKLTEKDEGALRNKLSTGIQDISDFAAAGPEAAVGATGKGDNAATEPPATPLTDGPGTKPPVVPMEQKPVDPFQ